MLEIPEHPDQQPAARAPVACDVGQEHGVLAERSHRVRTGVRQALGGRVDHEARGVAAPAHEEARRPPGGVSLAEPLLDGARPFGPVRDRGLKPRYLSRLFQKSPLPWGRKRWVSRARSQVAVFPAAPGPVEVRPEAGAGLAHLPPQLLRPLGPPPGGLVLAAGDVPQEGSRRRLGRGLGRLRVGGGFRRSGAPIGALAGLGDTLLHPFLSLEEGFAASLAGFPRTIPDRAPQLPAAAGGEEYAGEEPRRPAQHEASQPLLVQHLRLPPGNFLAHSNHFSRAGSGSRALAWRCPGGTPRSGDEPSRRSP